MVQLYFNFHLIMLNGWVNLHLQAASSGPIETTVKPVLSAAGASDEVRDQPHYF